MPKSLLLLSVDPVEVQRDTLFAEQRGGTQNVKGGAVSDSASLRRYVFLKLYIVSCLKVLVMSTSLTGSLWMGVLRAIEHSGRRSDTHCCGVG